MEVNIRTQKWGLGKGHICLVREFFPSSAELSPRGQQLCQMLLFSSVSEAGQCFCLYIWLKCLYKKDSE